MNIESDPQSLCLSCGQTDVEGIWTQVQSHVEFLAPSQPFLPPWAAFRLSYIAPPRLRAGRAPP